VLTLPTTTDLLARVDSLRPLIAEHAPEAEANRELTRAVYDSMYDAGLFGMLAPTAYGGLELHPVDAMRVWEAVARVDASAAWNLVMNQGIAAFAAWLPAAGAAEIFGHGAATVAGALNPPGTAWPVDGGCEGKWTMTVR